MFVFQLVAVLDQVAYSSRLDAHSDAALIALDLRCTAGVFTRRVGEAVAHLEVVDAHVTAKCTVQIVGNDLEEDSKVF